jgi:uncharacterized membrane protein
MGMTSPIATSTRVGAEIGTTASEKPERAAQLALIGHVALLVFSGIAFATFLAPPAPAWLQAPANQRVAAFMFMFGGQTTVVLGAVAGLLHGASRLGWRRALSVFAVAFSLSLFVDLTRTSS